MEQIVAYCIGLSIAWFIFKECVVLYIARTKQSGILLESPTPQIYPNELPAFVRLLDMLLIVIIGFTLLLYTLFMYVKLTQSTMLHELQAIDIGVAVLLYILFPSRKISYMISDKGLQQRQRATAWESIYTVKVGSEPSVRRMLFIQFKSCEATIEGYIYERDLNSLKTLLARHPIQLKDDTF